jgi:hypothetical protein
MEIGFVLLTAIKVTSSRFLPALSQAFVTRSSISRYCSATMFASVYI